MPAQKLDDKESQSEHTRLGAGSTGEVNHVTHQQVTNAVPTRLYAKPEAKPEAQPQAKFEAKPEAKFEGQLYRLT